MVRVALCGLGFMGKTHLGVYSRLKNVEVTSLYDINPEALDIKSLDAGGNIETSGGAIDLSGVKRYTEYSAMLKYGGFDYIDICLPTYFHAEYSIQALDTGYHVFCEKPIALDEKSSEEVLEKVEKTGRLFSVGQCLRFWPAYVESKKLIDSGQYGKVRYAEFARFSSHPDWAWDNWIFDSSRSGQAALDLHIHDVDLILSHFGFPQSVRSSGVVEDDGGISQISTVYFYDNLTAASSGGWICSSSFGFNMRAFYILEGATIELDFSKDPVVSVSPEGKEKYSLGLPDGDGYYYELKDFVAGIEKGRLSGIVTARSAADSVKLCYAEIRSVKEGKEIEI